MILQKKRVAGWEQHGPYGYDGFKPSYSEQYYIRGPNIQQIFKEMAGAYGFRGLDERSLKKSYGQGYRTFEFRKVAVFGRGFIIFAPGFGRKDQQEIPVSPEIFQGYLGRLPRDLLKEM